MYISQGEKREGQCSTFSSTFLLLILSCFHWACVKIDSGMSRRRVRFLASWKNILGCFKSWSYWANHTAVCSLRVETTNCREVVLFILLENWPPYKTLNYTTFYLCYNIQNKIFGKERVCNGVTRKRIMGQKCGNAKMVIEANNKNVKSH